MPKVGDLVRVKQDALIADKVVKHGTLWVRTSAHVNWNDELHLFRSIATGFEWGWYDDEFEEAGDA